MRIADKIKNARIQKGYTQEQVAENLLVSRQTISNWENGKSLPDIISIIKMSELYELSLDEMMKGDKALLFCILIKKKRIKSNKLKFSSRKESGDFLEAEQWGFVAIRFCGNN